MRGGAALPWIDLQAFLRRAFEMALDDRARATGLAGWIFFDRSLIDAAAGLERAMGEPVAKLIGSAHRYHQRVFVAPPWLDIHVTDQERRQDFGQAVIEYRHLLKVFPALGYQLTLLPKLAVAARADFVLKVLEG